MLAPNENSIFLVKDIWHLIAKDDYKIYAQLMKINKNMHAYMEELKPSLQQFYFIKNMDNNITDKLVWTLKYGLGTLCIIHQNSHYIMPIKIDDDLAFGEIKVYPQSDVLIIYINGKITHDVYNGKLRDRTNVIYGDDKFDELVDLIRDHVPKNESLDKCKAVLLCCDCDVVRAILSICDEE